MIVRARYVHLYYLRGSDMRFGATGTNKRAEQVKADRNESGKSTKEQIEELKKEAKKVGGS